MNSETNLWRNEATAYAWPGASSYRRCTRRTLGEKAISRHFKQGHLNARSSGKAMWPQCLQISRLLDTASIGWNSPSTTQYGQRVSFSDTQVTHFADFANIGWSLDNVTERSNTLSFMVSAILFAFCSDRRPSRLKFRVACVSTETVPWKSSTRMTGFPPSPSTATKRQGPRSRRA